MNADKKITKKTIIGVIAIALLISPFNLLCAEDYPAAYSGSGYREYLSDRIGEGYHIEVFSKMDRLQEERVNKKNDIEKMVTSSYQANAQSAEGILAAGLEPKYNSDNLKIEIAEQRQEREKGAAASLETGFYYIPYSDGKISYFRDGLLVEVKNERVVDEFGNLSIKNTYNMKYNDKRLLTSYEATLKDNLGNISYLQWYGATYSEDSVFYADDKTSAHRNLTEYYQKETDSAGNVKLTHWKALSYEGKLLRAFHQRIEDSIYGITDFTRTNITYANNDPNQPSSYHEEGIGSDGLAYTLDRTNITYNGKDQLTGYSEEIITTQLDGTKVKTTVDAQFRYLDVPNPFARDVEEPDPNKLLESVITQRVENADGSTRTETTTTTYKYEGNQLISGSANSEFNGQEAGWYEYTDAAGHILSRSEDKNGNITYSYIAPETLETVIVPADQVSATLKDGNKFKGTSEIQYEILSGKPLAKQAHSITSYYGQNISEGELVRVEDSTITYNNGWVNNLPRAMDSQEHTEITSPLIDPDNSHIESRDITSTNIYDEKGNLADVLAFGYGSGWEYQPNQGWYGQYSSTITEKYMITLGKPLSIDYQEDKDYE